ncbi:DUF4105 domain-containing protein [Rheinheimera baltica]|uniref:lipoprotein N-acyltransferase Lnb domain-containing protein n=1 Tax=Rheinheimera baltica TaxID=67576 RepID=UPI000483B710|nr:DUF4105 domain-containing protein [Rheinheimera baltica]
MLLCKLRGAVLCAFFLLSIPSISATTPLWLHHEWQALLHLDVHGESLITDAGFMRTASAEAEFKYFVAAFFDDKHIQTKQWQSDICRYPARYIWLRQQLQQTDTFLPAQVCADYNIFRKKMPADSVTLVYAAENITQPSSMMGHAFLAFSGHNEKGIEVSHALTFFTDVDLSNVALLIWQSIVSGKQGHLIVSPYKEQLQFYLKNEQRNVFEYPVATNSGQRELLMAHLWELKQTELSYYFHTFNCATLTNNLLALLNPELATVTSSWLSPLDVVKINKQFNVINHSNLLPSDKWKVRTISPLIGDVARKYARDFNYSDYIQLLAEGPEETLLALEFAQSLLNYNYQQGTISAADYTVKTDMLISLSDRDAANAELTLSNTKDPTLRPADGQMSVSYIQNNDVVLSYLPASHKLSDNHKHAFSESELQLFSSSVSYNTGTGNARLQELTVYSVSSFIPYDPYTGGWSGRFSLGAARKADSNLENKLAAGVSGALGLTTEIHADIYLYGLMNISADWYRGLQLSAGPEVGLMMYQLFNNKTLLSYRRDFNQLGSDRPIGKLSWTQSWFFSSEAALIWQFDKILSGRNKDIRSGLTLRFYF